MLSLTTIVSPSYRDSLSILHVVFIFSVVASTVLPSHKGAGYTTHGHRIRDYETKLTSPPLQSSTWVQLQGQKRSAETQKGSGFILPHCCCWDGSFLQRSKERKSQCVCERERETHTHTGTRCCDSWKRFLEGVMV